MLSGSWPAAAAAKWPLAMTTKPGPAVGSWLTVRLLILNVSGGASSAWSLAQLSAWCNEHLGHHQLSATAETRPYDLPWVVLDHGQVTEQCGWRPQRTTESILAEIAGMPAA